MKNMPLKLDKWKDMLYRMARHIANVNNMGVFEWGTKGCDLLSELQEMDEETYDRLVKKND